MPHGKGTYGSKVGRPAKKSPMNKNGDPKKKATGKFQSKEQAVKNIKAFGKGEGRGRGAILSGGKSAKDAYKEAGKKVDMVKNVAKNPYPKGKPTAIDKARAKSPMNMNGDPKKGKTVGKLQPAKPVHAGRTQKRSDQTPEQRDAMRKRMREGATFTMPKGPRSEGKRGKGTGWAN